MDRKVSVGIDSVQSQLYDLSDAVFIDLMHAEGFDAVLLYDAPLAGVDIPETDVRKSFSTQRGLDPRELGHLPCNAKEEC